MNKFIIVFLIFTAFIGCKRKINVLPAKNCSVSKEGIITTIKCPDGSESKILDGSNGSQGEKGEKGEQGEQGLSGTSCYTEAINGGVNIICGESSVTVMDGRNGTDGLNGSNSVLETIDPCGDDPNNFDEFLIKLSDQQILAYFEDKGKRFLTILTPGNYETTDNQKCKFTISQNYDIIFP